MVTIDGSLLVGIAAILSSLGGLLRAIKLSPRGRTDTKFNRGPCHCCDCGARLSGSGPAEYAG